MHARKSRIFRVQMLVGPAIPSLWVPAFGAIYCGEVGAWNVTSGLNSSQKRSLAKSMSLASSTVDRSSWVTRWERRRTSDYCCLQKSLPRVISHQNVQLLSPELVLPISLHPAVQSS